MAPVPAPKPVDGLQAPLRVTPAEFVSRTALRIGKRTPNLLKVDAAYAAFFAAQTDRALANKLLDALHAYKREIGGDWAKSERNTKSGGLISMTEARIKQEGDRKKWWVKEDQGVRALQRVDIPHSRYGVLYLLGNTEIELNALGIVLEGVSALSTSIGTASTTNYDHLNNAKAAAQTVTIDGQRVATADIIGGSGAATRGLGTVIGNAAGVGGDGLPKTRDMTVGGPPPKVPSPIPVFPCTLAGLEEIGEDPVLYLNPFVLPATLVVGVTVAVVEAMNALRVLLMNAITSVYEMIKAKLLADATFAWDVSGALVKRMIKFIVGKCLANAVPFVNAGMDIGAGIIRTIQAAKEKIGVWLLRKKIRLMEGHPALLAAAIEGEMEKGMFVGLWAILKGVASMALASFLPGAGSLVAALVVGIEWLVKMVWRIAEQKRITAFLAEAKTYFRKERLLATRVERRGVITDKATGKNEVIFWHEYKPNLAPHLGGLIHDLPAFKKFYKQGCDASPIIPIITLNSGICGSLMTMIEMTDGWNNRDAGPGDKRMLDGAEYFYRLKEFGRKYLESSGFKLMSSDKSVARYLAHAKTNHTRGNKTLADKALAFAGS